MGTLEGKIAVITGGTSGIGARTAELFVEEGARVVVGGRRQERGDHLVAKLGKAASYVRTDVSVESDVAALIRYALEQFGRLDCLFNNAGDLSSDPGVAKIDIRRFDAALALHVRGPLLGMKYAAPIMIRQRSGSIINMASLNGTRAGLIALTYATAKAALIHLTKCVAVELGPHGIRVNSVSPTAVITGLFGKALGLDPDVADREAEVFVPAFADLLAKRQPLPGMPTTDDLAQAVLFLASDASRFVTAHDLVVDGGVTAGGTYAERMATLAEFQKVFESIRPRSA
jgi:NAD(P)-dependent dehydrogenase (short-subunit alcohol dehydrogenase family)